MPEKSLLRELRDVELAIQLIELGARMQVLEAETQVSRPRLMRLYKEIRGMPPPKGMLPFSTDWFITWLPNIHSSLFFNFYATLRATADCERTEAFVKAYRLYHEQVSSTMGQVDDPVLSLTRAWTLVRFTESDQLHTSKCTKCLGRFISHPYTPAIDFVCGICRPPSRAGSGKDMRKEHSTSAAGSKVA